MRAAFSYHRAIAPMMWMLVALMAVEMLVVHALLAFWWPRVALVLTLVSLGTMAWLVRAIRSFRHLPVLIDGDRLVLRAGRLRSVTVERARIVGLRATEWTHAETRAREVLNLALIAFPNVWIDLAEPLAIGRRRIVAVAHRLDDPAAFAAALSSQP
ncbi:hypothetical protein GCM10022253_30670 [Sphingomonas endophytica]|uniref:PH domain-containing protein n=1 Tax=Sphingomonas endophytica TaxID=869719 RepID=A0ABR6N6Z8_9SPHN|nr:hypothetical protein [Sphingomonas endophytica]MBB5726568.1 hypothetical protein [Sphingomonas endophytica]